MDAPPPEQLRAPPGLASNEKQNWKLVLGSLYSASVEVNTCHCQSLPSPNMLQYELENGPPAFLHQGLQCTEYEPEFSSHLFSWLGSLVQCPV